MSKSPIIKVEGLSKKYLISKNSAPSSDTLYGKMLSTVKDLRTIARKKKNRRVLGSSGYLI